MGRAWPPHRNAAAHTVLRSLGSSRRFLDSGRLVPKLASHHGLCVANCRFCRNLQFATAASIPPLGLTHPVCVQYLRFAFWKSVQPTACFVRLASKGPEPA